MQIEEGKYYKTRGGHVVGPIERDDWGDGCPWAYDDRNGYRRWVDDSGAWVTFSEEDHDLIEEWAE